MALIDFQYIKTGTGELSGPSFVAQTEQAINELGDYFENVEDTANSALSQAQNAQQTANAAQQTANSAVSQAQNAQASADAAQQAADQAQTTADNALEAAQNAGDEAGTKAPIMHASTATTYGVGSSTLYGHVQLSDATNGAENAASGGTAATPYAVAQAMTAAQTAQSTANSAAQVGNSAQQTANQAQSAAEAAQNTADSVQTSLDQAVSNINQQITALTQLQDFVVTDTAIDVKDYAGSFSKLYLTSSASASTGLPSGISYPCFFWTERTADGDTAMMYVLSDNVLYSQSGVNTTPDGDTDTWTFTGWQKITYTAATTSALGVVKADGTTVEVAADGTLSINTNLLAQVYKFKGSVATVDDLPSGAAQGDVYNVTATDANYAWTGSAWDNIGGITAVDSSPVQKSTNPVSSGGVYTALENLQTDLEGQITASTATPDGVTIANNSANKLMAQDIAIGGDEKDLASASGLLGTCKYISGSNTTFNIDTDIFDEAIVYSSATNPHGTFPVEATNNFWYVQQLNYQRNSNASRLQLAVLSYTSGVTRVYIRAFWNTTASWTPWVEYITTNSLGDGIKNTNGIISVPEYEGATASAAATSGLVPPAAAGKQAKPLRGDGTWADSLDCNITGLASKATADASGNTITATYATKNEVSALKSSLEADINAVEEKINTAASPDYSSGIALAQPGATEQTYTAPADGYIVYSILGFNNVFAKIYINNILVVNSGTTANTTYWPSTGQLRVSKNDVIKYSCNGDRPENFMTFYPCKGA